MAQACGPLYFREAARARAAAGRVGGGTIPEAGLGERAIDRAVCLSGTRAGAVDMAAAALAVNGDVSGDVPPLAAFGQRLRQP